MNNVKVGIHPFRLALRAPLVTGRVSVRHRSGVLVSISDSRVCGWGEASPLPGWAQTPLTDTETLLHQAAPLLEARLAAATPVKPCAAFQTATHLTEGLGLVGHARAAVVGALFDLWARQSNVRLADFLLAADPAQSNFGRVNSQGRLLREGASASTSVSVNALVTAVDPKDVAQATTAAVRQGFSAVKLKVGMVAPEDDVDRIDAARSAAGAETELRLDANGAWDSTTATRVLEAVADWDISFCEEPVSGIEAIAEIGEHTSVPVAVDESMRNEIDAHLAIVRGITTLIIKPQALGGPDVALRIAAQAHNQGARVIVTSFMDSAVGLCHAAHVAAAVDAMSPERMSQTFRRHAHGLATAGLFAQDVAKPPPITRGRMKLSAKPGIGINPHVPGRDQPPPR